MKKTIIAGLLLGTSISQADIIRCNFTEPFVQSTYSMTKSTLTYQEALGEKKVIRNVSFQIKDAGIFELVGKHGKILQTLKLNKQGSDGMSDNVYPYEVKDTGFDMMANNGIGGCSSNYLKTESHDGK
ncbi:MAG: hypothetical protein ACAH59_01495 [Pseudobdellovibrionaceae bacterium]